MKSSVRWAAIVICVLAAGVCYSCGSASGDASGDQMLISDGGRAVRPDGADEAGEPQEYREVRRPDDAAFRQEDAPESGRAVCYVHVCGEVMNPGVYQLEDGSRIYEAVEKAGGFTPEAAEDYLNLAQRIEDGMKIEIPSAAELETAPAEAPGIPDPAPDAGRVNINTADKALLMTLKGIGDARAEDIISYRNANGPFRTIEEIMKVPGIKQSAFDKIRDDITV